MPDPRATDLRATDPLGQSPRAVHHRAEAQAVTDDAQASLADREGVATANVEAGTEADRERLVIELLSKALELDDDDRRSFLDRKCGADEELREELEALLAEESEIEDSFLEVPPAAGLADGQIGVNSEDSPTLDMPSAFLPRPRPERLGPYRVVDTLGQGGMGTVYLGQQEQPVRRRVALKVIDAIHDSRQVRRFAIECQALAHLNHPNVASLYEVGVTEDDQPFVAMELVEGDAITAWCDQHKLRLRQRIELFFGVCAGVRHAHEKGILHRDLKPSNVLVTEVDGRPTAKVIDFGIARALDGPLLAEGARASLDHQIVGSPAYMSPEAAAGQRDVDTRSDVYSLGLLLYELLAGVLPFDLEGQSLATVLQRLARDDLSALGKRFSDLEPEHRQRIAERRMLRAERLQHRLRGDLGAIVSQATARDREQRYSSPADLAADLERHLANQPVAARPPSFSYLLGRTLRRRMGVVSAVSALILVLAAGIVASTREARRANLEARQAREVSRFLVDLFEIADPERSPEEPVDVRELLDRGAERLRHELVDQPLARARLLHTICEIYTKMALFEQAEALALEALELRQAELPAQHPDLLDSVNQLGVVYRRQNRFDDAEPLLRRVLAARESAAVPDSLAIAQALNNLGNLLWSQRRSEEAAVLHRRALEIRERELGPDDRNLGESLNNLGVMLRDLKRYEEAEPYLRRADEIFVNTLGVQHPRRAAGLNNLGIIEHKLWRWQESEAHLREAAAIWQATYGEQHPRTLMARFNLAVLLLDAGREAESAQLLRDVLRIQEELESSADRTIASTLRNLGIALGRLGDFEPAEAAFQRALAIYTTARGEEHSSAVQMRSQLAWLAWRRGRFAEAEAGHRNVLEIRKRLLEPKDPKIGSTLHELGVTIADQGRHEEAELLLRRALTIREAAFGASSRIVGSTLLELGELTRRTGPPDEAQRWLHRALDIYRETLPPDHRELRRATEALQGR